MKTMKKIASLLLALAMIFALATTAFAQEVDSEQNGPASITIQNASKGVTYNVVKLFDATVVGESISYNGNIPGTLSQYFEKDSGNNILFKQGADEANAFTAMKTWAATQNPTATAKSDGGELTFKNLEYGYYVITTATGTAVTVDSTKPNATVYDKNAYTVGIVKTVDDADVYIGQTVNYTLTATTSNYLGQGENAQLVTEYVITDTLPEFLINVEVTEITIGGEAYTVNDEVPQFENKKITIPWVDDTTQTSLYDNGAQIVVKYSATVTNSTVIDGKGNKNEVTLSANGNSWKDDEVIFTYAAALQKVDQNKKPLAGAKFSAKGLTAEKLSDGVYRVVSYDPNGDFGTEMETDAQGQLVILGLASDNKLTVKETVAPAGYNILVGTVEMTPVKTSEEITATDQTIYYDANGNVTGTQTNTSVTKNTYNVNLLKTAIVVINQAGTELPSTGGMGTTLFYVLGGILVAVAVVLLVTKKRMASNN